MRVFLCLILAAWGWRAAAAEPEVPVELLPRIAPTEPKNALNSFQVKTGFHLQLVASEPLVMDPIAGCFDERGRLFIVEMRDYSERREEIPHLGRIRLLEDTNQDGIFDRSTIYADNLPWPTAVFCWKGGVFVAATPDILYLKDQTGSGKADRRDVVFSGFAAGVDRINVQALLNSFNWGLDNQIHGATSLNGALVRQLYHPDVPPLDLRGRDFRFDPSSLFMTSEPGGGQHGLSFDSAGRRFACNNSDHIRLFMYDDSRIKRSAFYDLPPPLISIAEDGPAAEVYRISPEEPWRVIRTLWRVSGQVSGPVEGGGRASGYFTGATGTTIYRGNLFPEEFKENAFIGDAGGNLVHRKILSSVGPALTANRSKDETFREFVASKDIWFRPVQFLNGPDGALYILDMYREVIEHPWSLPKNIKKHLDLNSGNDRGRIYRVVPDSFRPAAHPVDLGILSSRDLVATLQHPNGWHRDTAARLIYERQDKSLGPALAHLLSTSSNAFGRLHALYALAGLKMLNSTNLMTCLHDPDPSVRQHALCLASPFLKENPAALFPRLTELAGDPDPGVAYDLAFALGGLGPERSKLLSRLLRLHTNDPWITAAALNSVDDQALQVYRIVDSAGPPDSPRLLADLARMVGRKNERGQVQELMASQFAGERWTELRSLLEGVTPARLEPYREKLIASKEVILKCLKAPGSDHAPLECIHMLGFFHDSETERVLLELLRHQDEAVAVAALSSLDRRSGDSFTPILCNDLKQLSRKVQNEAVAVLLKKPDRIAVLLGAVQEGKVSPSILSLSQQRFLLNHPELALRKRAVAILPKLPASSREQSIEKYQRALTLPGKAEAGKRIYLERCSSCHRLEGEGYALGPDLLTVRNSGKEKLLVNILDPNREVSPNYIGYIVETTDNETFVGLLANQSDTSITVKQASGKETILRRTALRRIQSQGQSLMPEGLENGLTGQDVSNLLEYIGTAK